MLTTRLRRFVSATRWAIGEFFRTPARQLEIDKRAVEKRYLAVFGRTPDLAQPRTLTEKLNWRKLYDRNPLLQIAADRVAVRDYVAARVGPEHLIPALGVFKRPEEIPWRELSPPYVVKTTHGSGMNIFVTDPAQVDVVEACRKLRGWLDINYYYGHKEWCYKNVPRRIIIERLLGSRDEPPEDFKFFCFNGVPRVIQVDQGRFNNHTRTLYDPSWRVLPFECDYPPGPVVPAPSGLAKLLRVASELSRDFDFVRVDLYYVEGRVYFGELTNHPAAGLARYRPPEWDQWLGAFWVLPEVRRHKK